YFLFPILLAGLARILGHSQPPGLDLKLDANTPEERLPRIAMIVAAFNEAEVLESKFANTWQLDYPESRFEILIGSDGASDDTGAILKSCKDRRLRAFIFEERRGKISVLNDLLQQTDAEIVVMSDANTMFAPDAIRQLVRHFQDPRVGCVS